MNIKNYYIIFFFISILSRLIHLTFSNYKYDFCCDVDRYLKLSENIINGNFNLVDKLFIVAPFYPYYLALLRIISNENFINFLIVSQILISSTTTIFIMKITKEIFKNRIAVNTSGLIYSIYPTTLFYTHMIGQETFFQFFFIISSYYFCKFTNHKKIKDLFIFSLFITLSFLTKSHVSIIIIFFLISIFILSANIKRKLQNVLIVIITLNLICFPNALYNYKKNGIYVLSTTGFGMAMSSNSDNFYNFLVEAKNISELKDPNIINLYPPEMEVNASIKEKEKYWLKYSIEWIKNNPKKFMEMKLYNFYNFIMPGVNIKHYTFKKWLILFIISFPLYIFAYLEIIQRSIINYKKNFLIISVFLGMLIYSTLFFPQDRLNYIILEPLYIIYFSNFITKIFNLNKIKSKINF